MSVLAIDTAASREAARHLDSASDLLTDAAGRLSSSAMVAVLGDDATEVAQWCRETGLDTGRTAHLIGLVADRTEQADGTLADLDRWIDRTANEIDDRLDDRAGAAAILGSPALFGDRHNDGDGTRDDAFLSANDALGVRIPAGTDVASVASVLDQLQTRQDDHMHPANASKVLAIELFAEAVRQGDLVLNDEGWYEAADCDGQCWPSGRPASQVILGVSNQVEAEAIAEGTIDMMGVTSGVMSISILRGFVKRIRPGAEADLPSRVVTTSDVTYGGPSSTAGPGAILPKPSVSDPKLRNYVDNLYKGVSNPNRVGTGTTADAVRAETLTGMPSGGRFHRTKAEETVRGLKRWLRNNPDARDSDRLVAQSLLDELTDALGAGS